VQANIPGLKNAKQWLMCKILQLIQCESFYVITIPQLGAPVRGANSLLAGTFVIPITSAGGYRTYFGENSAYHQIAGGNGVSLSNLDVHITWGSAGGTASIGGDFTLIIQLA
jgi:hypothetical protein